MLCLHNGILLTDIIILLLKPQVSVTQAASVTGWPVTVGVVEVGVVDTRYGVSQPGADAER